MDDAGSRSETHQRFFYKLAQGRPKFKKARKYTSFTFPHSGYKVDGNTVTIDGVKYQFVKLREIGGQIKTLTMKRDPVGRLWLIFSIVENADSASPTQIEPSSPGKNGGFDFGLKTFLVDHEGTSYTRPQFFAQSIRKTRRLQRQLSRKVEGSHRRQRAQRTRDKVT